MIRGKVHRITIADESRDVSILPVLDKDARALCGESSNLASLKVYEVILYDSHSSRGNMISRQSSTYVSSFFSFLFFYSGHGSRHTTLRFAIHHPPR